MVGGVDVVTIMGSEAGVVEWRTQRTKILERHLIESCAKWYGRVVDKTIRVQPTRQTAYDSSK